VLEGLRRAVAAEPDLRSIGIDSRAVDYGLFRRDRLIGCPYHYRDQRTPVVSNSFTASSTRPPCMP
jgi:rhamnulokinase